MFLLGLGHHILWGKPRNDSSANKYYVCIICQQTNLLELVVNSFGLCWTAFFFFKIYYLFILGCVGS